MRRAHLRDVLESEEFSGSERRRVLLQYLVEETIDGRGDGLKAYRIGRTALGRPSGFDPQTDPIVRVEIGRLRSTLDRYYRAHPNSAVIISIPKGRYAAEFSVNSISREPIDAPPRSNPVLQIEPFVAASQRGQELADTITQSIASLIAAKTRDPASVFVAHSERMDHGDPVADRICRLRGTVRCVADRIRVSIEGYPPGSERPLCQSTFDDEISDGDEFGLADRLAERLTWLLFDEWGAMTRHGVVLADRGATADARAAQLRYYEAFETADPSALTSAAQVLGSAAAGDRADAHSAAALSDTMTTRWFLSVELGSETLDRAEALAIRSLTLDPHLVEAHLALAYVHFAKRRSKLMERELELALELAPPSPAVLNAEAIVYALDGAWERAEPMMERAVDLNPQLPRYWRLVPCIAALHREQFEEAYSQSLQIGDAIGWAGPALRLASALPLRLPLAEDLKQFEAMAPDPAVQPYDRTVAKCFHDPLVQTLVLSAIAAGRSVAV